MMQQKIELNEIALINLGKDLEIGALKGQLQQAFEQIRKLQEELEKYKPKKKDDE